MQLTAILSDLNSLRACDHKAALALVSSRPVSTTAKSATKLDLEQGDADLRRPHELRTLHKDMKLAYGSSANAAPTFTIIELQRARSDVDRAVLSLGLANEQYRSANDTQHSKESQLEQGHDMDYDEDDAWA